MKVEFQYRMTGKKFYPSALFKETGVPFEQNFDPGDIGSTGRYRNKPYDFGWGTWVFRSEKGVYGNAKRDAITTMEDHIDSVRKCGVEDIVLHVYAQYESQCNLEFHSDELVRIASMKIPLAISCEYLSEG